MICTKCKKDLPVDYFHKNQSSCKECRKYACHISYLKNKNKISDKYKKKYKLQKSKILKQHAKYRKTHKKERALYARSYRLKLRLQVLNHYTNNDIKCSKCGYRDIRALCLDHINGGGTQHRKEVGRGDNYYRDIIKGKFSEQLQVLCANCNMLKKAEKREVHHKYG